MNFDNQEYCIEIIKKNIKRLNIKVYPDCKIKVSAPLELDDSSIEKVLQKRNNWIKNQINKFNNQNRILKREYVSGEDHYINGKRYILDVIDSKTPRIEISGFKSLKMYIQKKSSVENKEKCMYSFYSSLLKNKIDYYLPKIEKKIGVKCNQYKIRRMKNKWACCNPEKKIITFNVELAKKNDNEIQYVITHELIHLIEKKHNKNFTSLMDKYYPNWEKCNENINNILKTEKK